MKPEDTTVIELQAPSVEEAIQAGLAQWHCAREDVQVEVLDEGSKGMFGLGAHPASVRLQLVANRPDDTPAAAQPEPSSSPEVAQEDDEAVLETARAVMAELLEKMHIQADITSQFGESERGRRRPVIVEVNGKDLSVLIGPRNETLDALQLIARLILSKELGHGISLLLDIQGHRKRNESRLSKLAIRMAEQAISTGRKQMLEPMPARDRRLIHIALRNFPGVSTHSIGEDPHRKVVIDPK